LETVGKAAIFPKQASAQEDGEQPATKKESFVNAIPTSMSEPNQKIRKSNPSISPTTFD
jgi:hypothetical protein